MRITWLPSWVLSLLVGESERAFPRETGGVLMGYWVKPLQEVVIKEVIGPGPFARHGSTRFEPDYEWQEKEIGRIYEESGRYFTYLGDWHSHPGGQSRLSIKDHVTLWRIANHGEARASTPLMGIMGGDKWSLTIWCHERVRLFNRISLPFAREMRIRLFAE